MHKLGRIFGVLGITNCFRKLLTASCVCALILARCLFRFTTGGSLFSSFNLWQSANYCTENNIRVCRRSVFFSFNFSSHFTPKAFRRHWLWSGVIIGMFMLFFCTCPVSRALHEYKVSNVFVRIDDIFIVWHILFICKTVPDSKYSTWDLFFPRWIGYTVYLFRHRHLGFRFHSYLRQLR